MTRYVLYFNNRYGCRTICKIDDSSPNDSSSDNVAGSNNDTGSNNDAV